jgi:hypothetical protein
MATTNKLLYGSNNQTITCSIASLANGSMQQSNVIDNTTNLFLDALVTVKSKTNAAGVSSTGTLNVYVYGTTDGGTTYTDGASGSDGAFTPTSPTNLRLIGVLNANTNGASFIGGPFSVAAAFGGVLPAKWGIVIENKEGAALDSTAGNHVIQYQGIQTQNV